MVDVYNEVRKTFIKPKSPVATESDISDIHTQKVKNLILRQAKNKKDRD